MAMKKMLLLTVAMFLVGLFFGSVALAQGTATGMDLHGAPTIRNPTAVDLAPSGGGPSILLPGAALLLGSGTLIYAIVRRRT
jgi:hypothetical protein